MQMIPCTTFIIHVSYRKEGLKFSGKIKAECLCSNILLVSEGSSYSFQQPLQAELWPTQISHFLTAIHGGFMDVLTVVCLEGTFDGLNKHSEHLAGHGSAHQA